jgi:hypothetical protein
LGFLGATRLDIWRMSHNEVLVTLPSQHARRLVLDKKTELEGPADRTAPPC